MTNLPKVTESIKFGKLDFNAAEQHPELVAASTWAAIVGFKLPGILVAEIDSQLADTAAFCEAYGVGADVSANCVVVEAKRTDKVWYAACVILATDKVDVNGIVRQQLAARKISFAPMETAVSLTKMEYGGITPIGLPEDWQILVDSAVTAKERVIIGSGIRTSKLLIDPANFSLLPNTSTLPISKTEN